jgi:hypothetical protein
LAEAESGFRTQERIMINAALTAGLGAIATAIGFGLSRLAQDAEWADAWDRVAALMKMLGAVAILFAFALLIQPTRKAASEPIVVTHTLSSQALGMQLKLPSSWTLEASGDASSFKAVHNETGAVLMGNLALAPLDDLNAAVEKVIAQERARSSSAQEVSRGVVPFGPLDGRWVELSLPGDGENIRAKILVAHRNSQTLTLKCAGAQAGQQACAMAFRSLKMAP